MKDPELVRQLENLFDSDFFKVLSEPVRLEILRFLAMNGTCSIGEVSEGFPQDRSVISRHLKQMSQEGMVLTEKRGRYIYYSINGRDLLRRLENMTDNLRLFLRENCPDCGDV